MRRDSNGRTPDSQILPGRSKETAATELHAGFTKSSPGARGVIIDVRL